MSYEDVPPQVKRRYGIEVKAYLAGRANKHWLAARGAQRCVLRKYQPHPLGDVGYEVDVLSRLEALGWPTPVALADPIEIEGRTWCLFRWLPGDAPATRDTPEEHRWRGRLLAELHADLEGLSDLGQRRGCGTADEVAADPRLLTGLRQYASWYPEEAQIMRWHLERTRECFAQLDTAASPLIVLHSDFCNRNLLYRDGHLTGVIDFEATHLNYRVSEFANAWRGKSDHVIHGYNEVQPLSELDWALLPPALWSWTFLGVANELERMIRGSAPLHGFEWQIRMLLRRTPLMGSEQAPYRD